jgi:hypothetical protein
MRMHISGQIFLFMLSSETLIKQFHNMTFVLKPQAPFDRLRLANSCPEVALNKAIILQACHEAFVPASFFSTLEEAVTYFAKKNHLLWT